jgi:hypothetical protein
MITIIVGILFLVICKHHLFDKKKAKAQEMATPIGGALCLAVNDPYKAYEIATFIREDRPVREKLGFPAPAAEEDNKQHVSKGKKAHAAHRSASKQNQRPQVVSKAANSGQAKTADLILPEEVKF